MAENNQCNDSSHILEPNSNKSADSFSTNSKDFVKGRFIKYRRTKSMSNADNFSLKEIRRITEGLLRPNTHLVQPSSIRSFTGVQKMTLAMLSLMNFFCFCSMSIMAPFFPKKAAEKGMSNTMSGIVFSFFGLVMFLSSPGIGKILPKFGAKLVFLSGVFVVGACNLLFGILEYVTDYKLFTTLCLVIRGFEALGASAFSTASLVFVINTFPNNIGAVMGILETFIGLGMSTGPALGGFLYLLGGFDLPFFVLGVPMIAIIPLNMWLLPKVKDVESVKTSNKTTVFKLIKIPAVFVTGLVVVVVSSNWGFLDPTLEPHLRQFDLTPEKIGFIFLLYSGLYGLSSPMWGCLADKINNHWSMMVVGLFLSTIGLLLLGPGPYILGLESSLWLNLFALSILGLSIGLALIPTFQGVIKSAIHGGCSDTIMTYSVVAGIWSSMYSLGQVVGPALGGLLLQYYGFPISATVMAAAIFSTAITAFFFFLCKSTWHDISASGKSLGSNDTSDSWRLSKSSEASNDSIPLLMWQIGNSYGSYTEEKVQYFENSRKEKNKCGEFDYNQLPDVRGVVSITSMGACEV